MRRHRSEPVPRHCTSRYCLCSSRQTNQSSVTGAYTSAQVAGDTNILPIGWNNNTSNITSVTDSAGNTYQLAVRSGKAGLPAASVAAPAGTLTTTVPVPVIPDTATLYV